MAANPYASDFKRTSAEEPIDRRLWRVRLGPSAPAPCLIALFLCLVVGAMGWCAAGAIDDLEPLVDLTVQSLDVAGPEPKTGWEFSKADLNKSVGGKYIYAGWKRGKAGPITDVDFIAYDSAMQDNPKPGWQWHKADLNEGAGGKFIYMFWKSENSAKPIYHLYFHITSENHPPEVAGFRPVGCDLNQGSGSTYIWAYITTEKLAPPD